MKINKNLPTCPAGLQLEHRPEGLTLTDGILSMWGDFTHMIPRLKYNNLTHELLVKAAKIKGLDHPQALDATAGMGEDSLLLAAAGFEVDLYEYNEVIAALLQDTIERSLEIPELAEAVSRMHLHSGDSIAAMRNPVISEAPADREILGDISGTSSGQIGKPDVILLDPMFPERQKSGLIKKKFQLLQQLESPCSDEAELFEAALDVGAKKIVVKRPAKGPHLAGKKPSYIVDGKAIRYDVYM